jgi:hypothetical protein
MTWSRRHRSHIERSVLESQKHLQCKRFLQYRQTRMPGVAALFALARGCIVVSPTGARRALAHRCVNTSLSGTLFF